MIRIFAVLALAALLAGCAEPPYANLDNNGLQALREQGVPVVDIRRPEEWRETGVVEGSRLMTFVDASGRLKPGFLETFTSTFGKDDPVVLICRTGNRTDVLARHLVEQMGYTQVYNVRDGITAWIREGRPVSRDQPPPPTAG
jgi:rhodanese-related sulfurtransferase